MTLQLGAVQMLAPSLAKFGPLGVKEFEVFDLPFIFDNTAELHKVTQGPVGKLLLSKLEPKGIRGLAFWDNGFKSFSANKPLRAPADFRGVKMRIQSSKVLEAQMRALGSLPQVMAFSEVYQALQTGVVDGTENPISNLYTQKMHEVQKHLTLSEHGYLGYAVIVNKKFWDGLPADVHAQLEQAMKEATEHANKIAQAENEASLDAVRKSGKTDRLLAHARAERLAFKKATGRRCTRRWSRASARKRCRRRLQGNRLRPGQACKTHHPPGLRSEMNRRPARCGAAARFHFPIRQVGRRPC
jgi:C4-dicarboxylate-binding protein DctP